MNFVRTAMLIAVMTVLFMLVGYAIGGSGGAMIALVIAAGMNMFSYWNSDKMVLRMHRAIQVDRSNAPEYYEIVEAMARRANLPMPKVFIIDNPQPNAFATGRNPQNAAVAATTGLLQRLNRQEVAAVVAHELAHVEHRDTLTMTITATLAGAISMLGNFALFTGGGRNNNNPLGFIGVILAMIVAPFAAMLVQMAISRTREYAADRRGAEIVGNPLWLASALQKIAVAAKGIRNPTAEANPASAPLFIFNPLHGERADNLFTTHPAVENRVAALEEMARQMGITGPNQQAPAGDMDSPPAERGSRAGPWGAAPEHHPDDAPEPQPKPRPAGPWGRNPSSDPWS